MVNSKVVKGLKVDLSSDSNFQCQACMAAKMSRTPFPKYGATQVTNVGDITHSDLWGPARVESIGRNLYYVAFIDDYSHYVTVKFLKLKSDATQKIKDYTEWVKTQLGCTIKAFCFDRGGEFMSKSLKGWLDGLRIEHQASAPYSPQQHGVTECPNRTLVELMHAMLIDSKLPKFLWAEAVLHAAYVHNRAMMTALTGMTPYKAMFSKKPEISHLCPFGSTAYILDESPTQSKLDPKAVKCIFVGYEDGPQAIRYFNASSCQVSISQNYTFVEDIGDISEEIEMDEFV